MQHVRKGHAGDVRLDVARHMIDLATRKKTCHLHILNDCRGQTLGSDPCLIDLRSILCALANARRSIPFHSFGQNNDRMTGHDVYECPYFLRMETRLRTSVKFATELRVSFFDQ